VYDLLWERSAFEPELKSNERRGFRMSREVNKRICVIGGAGHVGLPLSLVLADVGFAVDILDTNADALKTLLAGRMPFIENGAEDLLKRLHPRSRTRTSSSVSLGRPSTSI
jgi:UDP-N-acetyl-D-mannosaminuronic acid dehydrogenase